MNYFDGSIPLTDFINNEAANGEDVSLYSSLLKKCLLFPQLLQVHRQIMMSSLAKQMVLTKCSEPPLMEPADTSNIPDIPGLYLNTAFMLWNGWNLEDAAVISKGAANKLETRVNNIQKLTTTSRPDIKVSVGDTIRRGAVIATWEMEKDQIECGYPKKEEKNRFVSTIPIPGVVRDIELLTDYVNESIIYVLRVTVELTYKCTVGSKISNMHSSKSIISRILPDNMMPHCNGVPAELIISPYAIARRMAPSCIMEVMLNTYLIELSRIFRTPFRMTVHPFDKDLTLNDVATKLEAVGKPSDCMYYLTNGKHGKPYPNKTFFGPMRVGRLLHHSQDKIKFNNKAVENYRELTMRGTGAQRYGREEIEVFIEHGATGLIEEMKYHQGLTGIGKRIDDLLECIGYKLE